MKILLLKYYTFEMFVLGPIFQDDWPWEYYNKNELCYIMCDFHERLSYEMNKSLMEF